jgi:hypothetical protein
MNYLWSAIGGNYKWLNFSVPKKFYMGGGVQRTTAQRRVYGADCWTTLARPVSSDPAPCASGLPAQIHHPELASVAPAAGTDPKINLQAGHTARSVLDAAAARENRGNTF